LVREKGKNILNPSEKKLPIQILEEIAQGKISIHKLTTDSQKKEIKESNTSSSSKVDPIGQTLIRQS